MTLSQHPSQSTIAAGRFSRLHPVSARISFCWLDNIGKNMAYEFFSTDLALLSKSCLFWLSKSGVAVQLFVYGVLLPGFD